MCMWMGAYVLIEQSWIKIVYFLSQIVYIPGVLCLQTLPHPPKKILVKSLWKFNQENQGKDFWVRLDEQGKLW